MTVPEPALEVSVCITTFNRADALDRTLASLAAQTRAPDEVIVSDDHSTDATGEVARKWSDRFSRFTYQRNDRNLGMPGNLNAAIGLARGRYIANLHDADVFAPTLLEKWAAALDRFPSAGFVFSGIGGWPAREGSGTEAIVPDVAPLTPGREFFERWMLHRYSSIVWGTVMARRTAYDELLPFDSAIGFTSDVDMWMRMCLRHDVAYVPEPLIILDQSPTAERDRSRLNWRWIDVARRMQLVNLQRFFGNDAARLAREYRVHRWVTRGIFARRLAGRLRSFDRVGVREGLRLAGRFLDSGPAPAQTHGRFPA